MKHFPAKCLTLSALIAALSLLLVLSIRAAPGDVDIIDANPAGTTTPRVYGTTVQPDGKVIITGYFTSVLGQPRNYIARLNADGTLDMTFDPNANNAVYSVVVLQDGKILLGGRFTELKPTGAPSATLRPYLARLHADGSLDTSFDARASDRVYSVVVQPDHKLLLGGWFTGVRGQGATSYASRTYIARLHADGSLDAAFNPGADDYVHTIALQPDGKVLLGGEFRNLRPNGATAIARNYVARVNPDGTPDSAFDPRPDGYVHTIALQPDGKVLLSGDFRSLQPNGAPTYNSRWRIARLRPDGTLDASFYPHSADQPFECITMQADGKVLVSGNFNVASIGEHIARLSPFGLVDTSFYGRPNGVVYSLALQGDGRVLFGGDFTSVQQRAIPRTVTRLNFARLYNDPALQPLTVPDSTRILWTRGGAAPELTEVTFDLSTDQGANWAPLGTGSRIGVTADWQLTGLSLPDRAVLRARGRTTGGRYNGCSGLIEQTLMLGPDPVPEVSVRGNNISITSGDASPTPGDFTDFLRVSPAMGSASRVFTIANEGFVELTVGNVAVSGEHAADFNVTVQPASFIVPGDSTNFEVTFIPSATGLRTATLQFATNDTDENPFTFRVQGTGHYAEIAVSGNATDIASGDISPSPADHTDFGTTTSGGGSITRTFTIRNLGGSSLILGPVSFTGSHAADFAVTLSPAASVVDGDKTTLVVTYSPSSPGTGRALLSFSTSDADENPFTFALSGTAVTPIPGHPDPLGAGLISVWGFVITAAVQPDSKVMMGGSFESVYGIPRRCLARLHADGSLDAAFGPNPNSGVSTIAVQDDGKVLLGGSFSSLQPDGAPSSLTRRGLARAHPDGTLDTGFDPGFTAYSTVNCLAIQPDGRILVGGSFSSLQPNGAAAPILRNNIARVHRDGTLDSGFDPAPDYAVSCIALQADGKILLGGVFTSLRPNGAATSVLRSRIARVHADGTLDTSFNPTANGYVHTIAVQADGKILLGGEFTTLRPVATAPAVTRNYLARLNADGTLDTAFNPNPGGRIDCLTLQADGRILLGGAFPTMGSPPVERKYLARLNANGSLDTVFDPRPDYIVDALTLQTDGGLLVAGEFSDFQSASATAPTARESFARLYNGPAVQTLSVPSSTMVLWSRSGALPELTAATFDLSTDGGENWTPLGAATRAGTTANWELTSLALPPSGLLRARGRTTGGSGGGSSGIIEQVAVFPTLTPYENWKLTHLGDALAPDDGDPNGDGLINLLEYALNGDPRARLSAGGAFPRTGISPGNRLQLLFSRRVEHTDLTLTVQAADSPAGPWTDLARSTGGNPFTVQTTGATVAETGTGNIVNVIVTDLFARNHPDHPRRFMRLKVSR